MGQFDWRGAGKSEREFFGRGRRVLGCRKLVSQPQNRRYREVRHAAGSASRKRANVASLVEA